MTHSQRALAATLLLCTSLSWPAQAHDAPGDRPERQAADSAKALFGAGRVVDNERLQRQRGGVDTSNRNALSGSVHDNAATQVVTGSNTIAEGSFANASGLPTVIQNTGANVLIQNATIVNVQFK